MSELCEKGWESIQKYAFLCSLNIHFSFRRRASPPRLGFSFLRGFSGQTRFGSSSEATSFLWPCQHSGRVRYLASRPITAVTLMAGVNAYPEVRLRLGNSRRAMSTRGAWASREKSR